MYRQSSMGRLERNEIDAQLVGLGDQESRWKGRGGGLGEERGTREEAEWAGHIQAKLVKQ